jgi:heme exporter protein B
LLLPLILFPIFIPALLGMVMSATSILTGEGNAVMWIKLLGAYDVIFTTVCLMLFEVILHAE